MPHSPSGLPCILKRLIILISRPATSSDYDECLRCPPSHDHIQFICFLQHSHPTKLKTMNRMLEGSNIETKALAIILDISTISMIFFISDVWHYIVKVSLERSSMMRICGIIMLMARSYTWEWKKNPWWGATAFHTYFVRYSHVFSIKRSKHIVWQLTYQTTSHLERTAPNKGVCLRMGVVVVVFVVGVRAVKCQQTSQPRLVGCSMSRTWSIWPGFSGNMTHVQTRRTPNQR